MIDELRSFIQVVENQNFTKAAKKLNLSQPAVSLHISGLEKQLETKLIIRSNKEKNFLVTPDGEILYRRAKEIIRQYDEMIDEIKSQSTEVKGTLKIGASLTIGEYLLPTILSELSKVFPSLNFEVIIENSQSIVNKVNQIELEIGLVENEGESYGLTRVPFYQDVLQIAYTSSLKFPTNLKQYPAFLNEQVWLLREGGSGTREMSDFFFKNHGIELSRKIILGSNYLIKETLRQQPSVTFISSLMKEQNFEGIKYLDDEVYQLSRLFYYVVKDGVVLSKRVQSFIHLLQQLYTSIK